MKALKTFFIIVISLLFIVLAAGNRESVALDFFPLPFTLELPAFLLLIITFALGVITGGILQVGKHYKMKRACRHHEKREKALENELKSFRTEREMKISLDAEDTKQLYQKQTI